jgi:antitoxin (DNA-binding transcriptional repressor) of toxin-antitoxin stability system
MQQVSRAEAQERFDELLDAALRGEEVYIAGEGAARVRLVPTEEQPEGWDVVWAKGRVFMADDFDDPLPEFEEYTR